MKRDAERAETSLIDMGGDPSAKLRIDNENAAPTTGVRTVDMTSEYSNGGWLCAARLAPSRPAGWYAP